MEMIPYSFVRFSSIECKMQMSGELSVMRMVDAFVYAHENKDRWPTVADVLEIGRLIEPYDNVNGFRRCSVRIGSDILADWEEIPRRMVSLQEAIRYPYTTPDEWFYAYERCHPFIDGNGRSGAVIYSWLSGTLEDPDWPPNFFNDPRRTAGYGAPR